MAGERVTTEPRELSLEAKKQEVLWLLDDIEVTGLADKMDDYLKVAVSDPIRFLYKGEHFGLHAFTRLNGDAGVTRAVVLDAYEGDLPIPYHPHISSDLVIDNNGTITKKDDGDCEEVNDPDILNSQIEILRFFKKELPNASYDGEPLKEVSEAVSVVAEKLWKSKDMAFERAKEEFYEALEPVREKSKSVDGRDQRYKSLHSVVDLDLTDWASVKKDGREVELRYVRYNAYSNGSWTDFEEIRSRELGDKGRGDTLFEISDISRSSFPDLFGTRVRTATGVKRCTKVVKSMNAALEAQKKTRVIK